MMFGRISQLKPVDINWEYLQYNLNSFHWRNQIRVT